MYRVLVLKESQQLNEKASIDWNNYLTPEEVKQFLSKDDKIESAEEIIYSKEFEPRYKDLHNDLQKKYNNSWTKRELTKDLAEFYYNHHLIGADNTLVESSDERIKHGPYKDGMGTWTIDLADDYETDNGDNYIQENTRRECLLMLNRVVHKKINEAEDAKTKAKNLWKSQLDNKNTEELTLYLGKLYKELADFNRNNKDIRSKGFYDLLDKIEYVESKLGIKKKIGYILH